MAPLTLIAFFAAQLVRETHVWIYTSRDDRSYMNQIIQPVEQIRDREPSLNFNPHRVAAFPRQVQLICNTLRK